MAKATPLTGTGGNVSIGDFKCMFQSWRATIQIAELNTTGFEDAGWIDGKAINGRLIRDAVGVISTTAPMPTGLLDTAFGAASGLVSSVVLTVATGKTLTFNAIINAVELERAEEGQNNSVYRVRFASCGPVADAWT